jgi:hypothetical protein
LERSAVSGQPSSAKDRLDVFPIRNSQSEIQNRKGVNLKLSFPGSNPHPRLEPFDRLETHVSYFIGNDANEWRSDVPVWGGVRYVDLYPGIDLEITSENGQLVQRVVARDGADLSAMHLRVDGADKMALDGERLRLTTAVGEYRMPLLQSGTKPPTRPTLNGNEVTSPFAQSAIRNQQFLRSSLFHLPRR